MSPVVKLLKKFPNMERLDVYVPESQFNMDYAQFYGDDLTVFKNINFKSLSWTIGSAYGPQYPNNMRPLPSHEADIRQTLHERANELHVIGLVCKLTTNILKSISCCKDLTYLLICNENLEKIELDFQPLSNLKRLDTLQLRFMHNSVVNWNMSYKGVQFPRLVKLEIVRAGDSLHEVLRGLLSVCPELRHLNVQESFMLDSDFENIHLCKHLIHLDISENYNLTDECMVHVARGCHRLQFLDISYCFLMTSNTFKILERCRNLRSLMAMGNGFGGSYLHEISVLFPYLEEIYLDTARWTGRRRTAFMP
jgi:hypothetical protein